MHACVSACLLASVRPCVLGVSYATRSGFLTRRGPYWIYKYVIIKISLQLRLMEETGRCFVASCD